jgi:hypothetical protein
MLNDLSVTDLMLITKNKIRFSMVSFFHSSSLTTIFVDAIVLFFRFVEVFFDIAHRIIILCIPFAKHLASRQAEQR